MYLFSSTEQEPLRPKSKEPFSWLAEGLASPNWLALLDAIRNWLIAPNAEIASLQYDVPLSLSGT